MDILRFILILFVCVFIHELGHFLAAKMFKMKVPEFGIGFPLPFVPKAKIKLFSFQGTDFTLNPLLLGGFVRFDNKEFNSYKALPKIGVQAAGVIFNFILGFLIISFSFYLSGVPNEKVVVVQDVFESAPAYGVLQKGDIILSANWEPISGIEGFRTIINDSSDMIIVKVDRDGEEKEFVLFPTYDNSQGRRVIGVLLTNPLVQGNLVEITQATLKSMENYLQKIWEVISQGNFLENLSGLKTMYQILPKESTIDSSSVEDVPNILWLSTLSFFASINISLMILNILPLPGLDGGQIIMTIPEFFGIKIPLRYYALINNVGVLLLLTLIIVINVRDFL